MFNHRDIALIFCNKTRDNTYVSLYYNSQIQLIEYETRRRITQRDDDGENSSTVVRCQKLELLQEVDHLPLTARRKMYHSLYAAAFFLLLLMTHIYPFIVPFNVVERPRGR